MNKMRRSAQALLAAGLFALVAAALFVLGATRLSGDTVGMSLAIAAAAASALSAFGFLVQWRKRRREEETAPHHGSPGTASRTPR